jgi:hypothetical protein
MYFLYSKIKWVEGGKSKKIFCRAKKTEKNNLALEEKEIFKIFCQFVKFSKNGWHQALNLSISL